MADNNVFDSSNGPLGAGATWTSAWMDMRGFQAVTAVLTGDEIFAEARFEWSHDASVVQLSQVWLEQVNPLSFGGAATSGVTPQAQFVRLVVVNGGNAQGPSWRALVSLMQSPPTGFVAPLVAFPRDSDPGQTVRAILYGRVPGVSTPQYVHILTDGNGAVQVAPTPPLGSAFGVSVAASETSVQLDTGIFGDSRQDVTVFNDSQRGTLHIRLGGPVDIDSGIWDYKVLPQGTWTIPSVRVPFGGDIFGQWDVVDDALTEAAHVVELA